MGFIMQKSNCEQHTLCKQMQAYSCGVKAFPQYLSSFHVQVIMVTTQWQCWWTTLCKVVASIHRSARHNRWWPIWELKRSQTMGISRLKRNHKTKP